MDPLSIIASIAGIATAGAQLSSTLFRVYKTVRHAPREIESVAIEMAGLTVTLEHLHDILKTGRSYTKPSFFDSVRRVVENIETTQQEISKMVADKTTMARLKWLKAARYRSEIDKQKISLTLQIAILSAAILVKSNTGSSSVHERVDNRFRIQAENLIQTGQASLQRDSMQRQIPEPPPERAPSPPVRTTKRLPSPVRQSAIPGHIRLDELYGQSTTAEDNLGVPKQDNEETNSALVKGSRAHSYSHPHIHFADDTQRGAGEDEEYQNRRGRTMGYDPLAGGRVAQFGRHFHLQGDAATFLYKLVFMNEVPGYEKARDLHTESPYSSGDDLYSDTEDFDMADDFTHHDEKSRVPARYMHRRPREPARVVNQLLLEWTSLSRSEIEKGVADTQPTTTKNPPPKHAYVESDDESEDEHGKSSQGRSNWPESEQDARTNSPIYGGRRDNVPQAGRPLNGNDDPHRPMNKQDPRKYNHPPSRTAPYDPRMAPSQFNYQQPNYQPYDRWGYPYPTPATAWQSPAPQPLSPPLQPPTEKVSVKDSTPREPAKPKFQKPHVVVLPQADSADSEIGTMIPKLDVSPCMKMSILRQGEEAIWNSDKFNSENSIPGKAIMGTLIGDKSARNPHGLDLAHTLIRGQDMKLVYIRGNDFGETWFINEQPVFLQFFHSSYLPQFYPAKESDITAMKQEYVAVGEEWASFEALDQLGLPTKGREEGRVFLDPNTTWSMVKELAITTLQLRSMRQRRLYTSTFYNSIATFRQKHCGAIPEPLMVAGYPSSLHCITPKPQPETKLEREKPDVLSFLVKDNGNTGEVDKTTKVEMQQLHPQIAITPPPTPQESSSPELDTSDMISTVSSRSRFSRLVQRYRTGRKQSQLSLPLQRNNSRNSGNGPVGDRSEDDDKRPATPTDSGFGSSVG